MPHTEKLSREKTSANWRKIRFSWRKLSQIAHCWYQKMPNFAYKTFTNSHKSSKFTKVFSLKSFLLHGMHSDLTQAQPMCTSQLVSNVVMMTTYTCNTSSLLVLDFPAFLEWVCHKCLTIVLKLEGYSPPSQVLQLWNKCCSVISLVVSCFWSWPKDQDLDHQTLILVQQSVVWTQDCQEYITSRKYSSWVVSRYTVCTLTSHPANVHLSNVVRSSDHHTKLFSYTSKIFHLY